MQPAAARQHGACERHARQPVRPPVVTVRDGRGLDHRRPPAVEGVFQAASAQRDESAW
jgi:hypothetical protein